MTALDHVAMPPQHRIRAQISVLTDEQGGATGQILGNLTVFAALGFSARNGSRRSRRCGGS
ncbi:hypothetical protein SK854_05525 [Lentzea sp. BCCO 10_0061]|uniref:Uncharacterized protein n=1 Tax=Lentzea sokolovensis TaxID=3095429 RepID=A0ABU4UPZ4_9PSEU|nr:hypothetical protein [Lentzea sp. BCCO 10_0061]MDX8141563.1 hypothetical protein [Lentzea sp. BCCO 10_0061]